MFPDAKLDREHTIESNTFKSREVLSGSDVLRLKAGDVAARVSSVIDSVIVDAGNLCDAPGRVVAEIKRDWHQDLFERHNNKIGKSVIPQINRYHASRADKHASKLSQAQKVMDWYEGRSNNSLSGLTSRRIERQEALDMFAKRRVEAEAQRQRRIEAKRVTTDSERAGDTSEETKRKVTEQPDDPALKKIIYERAINIVRSKLGT